MQAAELLREETTLRWHIVGDGSELGNLKAIVREKRLDNVIFHGRKPPEEMPAYYAQADAMLVTLTADKFISLTLPGKVQTYMAAGKPIIGAAIGEIPQVIEAAQCGWCAGAEDAAGPPMLCKSSCAARIEKSWEPTHVRITRHISPGRDLWTNWKRSCAAMRSDTGL